MNIKIVVKYLVSGNYVENNKYQWKKMVDDIEAKYPGFFAGIDNPAEKIRKMVSTKQVQALIAAAEAKKLKKAVKKAVKKATAKAETATQPALVAESVHMNGNVRRVVALESDKDLSAMSSDEIIAKLGYDPKEMELVNSSVKMGNWDAQNDGKTQKMRSYRISGTVRPRKTVSTEIVADTIKSLAEMGELPEQPVVEAVKVTGNQCAIINLADVHYGCLADADQCGADYNLEIAEANIFHVINEAIKYMKEAGNIKVIYFHWCQDFFHFDNFRGTTTKGTPLETACTFPTMFRKGVAILVRCIKMLEEVAPVETFYVRSNHSEQTGLCAAEVLKWHFENDQRVTVDASGSGRKYRIFGEHLFGFGHGDKEGNRIAVHTAQKMRHEWGATEYTELFLGHKHHKIDEDFAGAILRYAPALVSPDKYNDDSAFGPSARGTMLYIRDEVGNRANDIFIPALF